MPKQRKTKKEKLRTTERKLKTEGFVIKDEWLKTKTEKKTVVLAAGEKKYFKADLTKTGILTMLVLALELAIWSYLSRH
ncbi:MAG: hypothetical protein UW68_C0007G0009 [Candidatus Collierbacteria bacterium GW2011_GWB1_44_6]|uniref:Uncharacterized protein n=1 Tax=Candidatus Collierbacteria bacterium GW2011_GWB1_44_6 TaxID=1618384 RepID=A0A0G1MNC0_9BACT|nr:MAG: hypothetical protein UW68_C0007G0009 [Candidatus Collierbacteria bacterium GW2011_GWB1_44_6]